MADHFVPVQHYGDWNLEKQLGYGACGTVRLWRNVKSTQEIAIKKCKFDESDERARDRWKTEVGMLKKIHHPNIVSYLAIPRIMEKQYPEYCSLGMEYCSAGDLRKFIGSQPEHNCGLAEYHVRDVMGDIGSAIYYLHQMNNMHRDLKPENIVLKPRPDCPERYLYKITDLGYAEDLDNTDGRTLVGTLQYLAPELVSGPPGELRYNTEVDCWSFGLVVFECATGFRPFFHLSNSEPALPVNLVTDKPDDAICAWHDRRTKNVIFCDTIPQPHSLNPHFSNDVGLWLRLMLRVDKKKRGGNNGEEWYHMLKNSILPKKYVHVLNTTNMQLITLPLGENALRHTVQIKVQQEASVDKAEQLLLFEDGNVPHMTENIFNQLTKIKPKAPDQPIIYFFDKRAIEWPVYKSETPDRIHQYFANENTAIDQGNRDGMRLMQIILHDILSKLKTALYFYDALFALAERRIKVAKNLRDELQEYRRTNFRTAGMVELFRISLEKDVAEDNSQDNSSGICASDEYIKECEALRMDLERWNREIDEGQSLIDAAKEIVSKTKSSLQLQLSKSRHDLSALRLASLKRYSEFRNEFKRIENSSTEYASKDLKTLCKEHLVTFVNNYWMKTKRMLEEALSPQSNLRKTMRFHLIQLTELERILFAMKDRSQKCKCVSSKLQDKQERRIRGVMDDMMMNADVLVFTNFAAPKKQNGPSLRLKQEAISKAQGEADISRTDRLDENTLPGTSVGRDIPAQSEMETEKDIAAGSVVRDERTQTVTKGISHPVVSERNPAVQVPRISTQENSISSARGGKIKSGNCGVKFPPGLLKHDANIKITVESGAVSDRSKLGIPISPILGCDLSHVELVPGLEMEVKILAYCFAREPVPIALLSKTSNSDDWIIERELMLGRDRKLKFKTSSFSRKYYAFMRGIGLGWLLNFPVIPHLYYNKRGVFKSYLCVDDKTIIDGLKAEHKSSGFASALTMPEHLIAKLNESIGVELKCAYPNTASFGDDYRCDLVSDDLIDKAYVEKDFVLENIPDHVERGFVEIRFTLAKIPVDGTPRPMRCRLDWPMLSEAIVNAEEARRQLLPPEVPDPKLVLEETKIRVSWEELEDERVTYCIDLYCNGQKRNPEPYRTPATYIEFPRLEPSCEYRCEVWARDSRGVDGLKTWSNAVETGSVSQAARQQYRTDDRMREDVGRHDPSYHQRRIRDEASTSTNIGHHDQVPCDIPEHRTIPKSTKSPFDLTLEDLQIQRTTPKEVAGSNLVKKIHPKRNRSRLKQIQPQMSRGRFVEEAQQDYHPFAEVGSSVDPPHMSLPSEYESSSETEEQLLPLYEPEPAETSPMVTVAEIYPRQNFNSSNFDEPSTSRRVPPNTEGIMISRQSEQYYYGGVEGSSYQGYRQVQMGFQGFPNTTGSRPFGLGMGTAPRAIVDAEEARRQAPPPEIPEPKLLLERTKIRVSWDRVEYDRVSYCVNIYCNNQLIDNTPMKTQKTEMEYPRLKPSCEYQCEVWTCNSRGLESAKTWSNVVNTPDTQECTPSEDGSRGGAILSQLIAGQGASLTIQNSTINFGGKHQKRSPEENEKQGSSTSSSEQQTKSRAQEEQEHQSRGSPESRRSEEDEREDGEVQEGSSDRDPGDSAGK